MSNNAAELYNACITLERQLREELKHKNFYEAAVRTVRTQLRSAYEALLFSDYTGSQVIFAAFVAVKHISLLVARVHTHSGRHICCRPETWSQLCGNQCTTDQLRSSGAGSKLLLLLVNEAESLYKRSVSAFDTIV